MGDRVGRQIVLGFGCYGSEIETPHVDALAESGLYCNQAGGGKLSRATTIAEVPGKAGYLSAKYEKPVSAEASPHRKGDWHKPQLYKDWEMPRFND